MIFLPIEGVKKKPFFLSGIIIDRVLNAWNLSSSKGFAIVRCDEFLVPSSGGIAAVLVWLRDNLWLLVEKKLHNALFLLFIMYFVFTPIDRYVFGRRRINRINRYGDINHIITPLLFPNKRFINLVYIILFSM